MAAELEGAADDGDSTLEDVSTLLLDGNTCVDEEASSEVAAAEEGIMSDVAEDAVNDTAEDTCAPDDEEDDDDEDVEALCGAHPRNHAVVTQRMRHNWRTGRLLHSGRGGHPDIRRLQAHGRIIPPSAAVCFSHAGPIPYRVRRRMPARRDP